VSPATRVRAWRVLDTVGRDAALRDPAALRLLLAPVFARSDEEQQRFYSVFERYVEAVTKPIYEPVEPGLLDRIRDFFSKKRVRWVSGSLLLLLLAGLAYPYLPKRPASTPKRPEARVALYRIEPAGTATAPALRLPVGKDTLLLTQPDVFRPGDSLLCRNATDYRGNRPDGYRLAWSLTRADGTVERKGGADSIWMLRVPEPDTGAERHLDLQVSPIAGGTGSVVSQNLIIACRHLPALPALKLPASVRPGQTATFALASKPTPGYRYRWQIIGDTVAEAPVLRHRFERAGVYEVQLLVTDTTQPGWCSADTNFTLRVGEDRAALPPKSLEYDRAEPGIMPTWLYWLLVGTLAFAAAWYWLRWARRRPPEPEPPQTEGASVAATASADKPPYYIPFREQKGAVRTQREQYRLADALRRRTETEDRVIDLPASLRATIRGGGYPALRYRFRTRPIEYLFLIDEQLPGYHLARLFRHLAETLRGQDVALDVAWYDPAFRTFRSPGLSGSLSLDALRRYYPEHRLVLLGAGHALLDDAPTLRPGLKAALSAWPRRLLLTPVPPSAWNWREATLYRHFGLFPADLPGMLDAAAYEENGLDETDLPAAFDDWKSQQTALRPPDAWSDYLSWRTLADHETYLKSYGNDLARWFRALAVYPTPTWEITLAVARGIAVKPTHERLLALSRIPALREGRLHPGLRREMLGVLPEADEQAARAAVLHELEEIQRLTAGSHVAAETEAYIVVQRFQLEPDKENNRRALAALLDAGTLSRGLEMELNVFVEKSETRAAAGTAPARVPNIREWLKYREPVPAEPEKPAKPFFTPDFWKAAALTALLALLGATGWMACRPQSPAPAFPKRTNDFTPGRDTLRAGLLFSERWTPDSALIYNNLGVAHGADTALFQRALQLRSPYALAQENLARVRYNYGADRLRADALDDARRAFVSALTDAGALILEADGVLVLQPRNPADTGPTALQLDALHGRGLCDYYAGNRTDAERLYRLLQSMAYFESLTQRPNLETLLGITQNRVIAVDVQPPNTTDGAVRITATYQIGQRLNTKPHVTATATDGAGKNISFAQITLPNTTPGQYQDALILLLTEPGKPARADSLRLRLYTDADRKTLLAERTLPFAFEWTPPVTVTDPAPATTDPAPKPDRDADGTPDDADGCPDDPNKTQPGACGCGTPDTDTDGDGIPDCNDKCPNKPAPGTADGCPVEVPVPVDVQAVIAAIQRNMISIPGGTFQMGSEDGSSDEKPVHQVTLSNFYMGKYEVTIGEYLAFCEETKGNYPEWLEPGNDYHIETGNNDFYKKRGVSRENKNHPVTGVSWNDAVAYCQWLSRKTGQTYRLPTEAEWEYAARGGEKGAKDNFTYAGSNDLDAVGWYTENTNDTGTRRVGGKKPNQLGLYDMSGNVWEWCADWYGDYPTGSQTNPTGPTSGSYRVIRGGSWYGLPTYCRVASRSYNAPGNRINDVGFRLARTF